MGADFRHSEATVVPKHTRALDEPRVGAVNKCRLLPAIKYGVPFCHFERVLSAYIIFLHTILFRALLNLLTSSPVCIFRVINLLI